MMAFLFIHNVCLFCVNVWHQVRRFSFVYEIFKGEMKKIGKFLKLKQKIKRAESQNRPRKSGISLSWMHSNRLSLHREIWNYRTKKYFPPFFVLHAYPYTHIFCKYLIIEVHLFQYNYVTFEKPCDLMIITWKCLFFRIPTITCIVSMTGIYLLITINRMYEFYWPRRYAELDLRYIQLKIFAFMVITVSLWKPVNTFLRDC